MKVIVDIKNKTLTMLENERSIFKGEYSADKLELYINKQLENEYPVITGLLSNGRRIGPYTTDSSYGIEQIDGMTYTTAEFTLSKENGFTLSEGLMQVTVWLYTTKNSEVVSKIAIGNITFNVVNTTSFNDGDIIISGDVEGTVVNLKVELENLQQVAQINNVAINNLQNNKADKTTLNDYLKRDGSKPMTGDLNMDDHDIKNVSTIGVDGTITTATKLLVHDENDDVIPNSGNNYNASFYHASGIRFTTAQEQSAYNLYYPKETGTFVVRNDSGGIKNITKIIDQYDNNGIVFGLLNDETTLYNPDSTIGLSSTEMINEGDIIHSLKFPDTSELSGDGSWNRYTWNLPKKSGTIALKEDIPTKVSQLDNDSGLITNAVDDLTNYYLKSETYTKSEVQQLVSTISSSLQLEVVTNLPTTNISSNTIYLKPLDSAKENNIYEEYIYINSKWETIGTTAVDLTNYALKEDIPTKISQLEQDVELGVSEEDVMEIVENNAESTTTLSVGTSATFNPESDKQIPTSKAVANMMADAGGSGNIIDLGKCFYNDVEYEDQYYYDLAIKIYNESKDDPTRTYIGVISDNEFKFTAWYDSFDCSVMIVNESLNEKITIYEPQDVENRELYKQALSLYGTSGITVEKERITLDKKTENPVISYNHSDGTIHCFEMGIFGGNCFIWYDYLLTFIVENNSYVFKIYLQDGNYYPVSQIIELPYKSEMIKHKVIFTYIEGEEEGYLTIQPIEGPHLMYDGIATVKLSAITRNEFKF